MDQHPWIIKENSKASNFQNFGSMLKLSIYKKATDIRRFLYTTVLNHYKYHDYFLFFVLIFVYSVLSGTPVFFDI